MADNYIERQQEQYEARKAAWKQAQKYGKKKLTAVRPAESKSHTSTVSKPEDSKRRVFITGGAEGIGKAIVEAFCLAGNQVAFCDINETSGQETAKATGAVFQRDRFDRYSNFARIGEGSLLYGITGCVLCLFVALGIQ